MKSKLKISFFTLVLLIVSAVDSNRNLPSAAIFGSPLIFFFIFSAFFFLFPVSLVSAELGASSTRQGGVYFWVEKAFGNKAGLFAIWLQWVQAVSWFPTVLTFLAGTGAFLIDSRLMYNKTYMVMSIFIIFWILTLINLRGVNVSAKLNEVFCIFGTLIPTVVLIIMGFIWVFQGEPLAINLDFSSIIPSFNSIGPWTALVAVMTSFSGMELAGVHINSFHNPQKMFPNALMLGSFIVGGSMLLGALSIAIVVPKDSIHLAGGLMQVFAAFFERFNLSWCTFYVSLMIVLGSIGNLINWISSPAKGLLHASECGFFPSYFTKVNRYQAPVRILIAQAFLVSVLCLLFLLLPSVNAFYWFLMAISSGLYMVMYIMMFFSAIKLRPRLPKKSFHIPLGSFGLFTVCLAGLIGCVLTIIVSFIPPPGIPIASITKYAFMIGLGNLIFIAPVFYLMRKKVKS